MWIYIIQTILVAAAITFMIVACGLAIGNCVSLFNDTMYTVEQCSTMG